MDSIGGTGGSNINRLKSSFVPHGGISGGEEEALSSSMQDRVILDGAGSSKRKQYVIIPPHQMAEETKKGTMFKSADNEITRLMNKMDVQVEEKLPIVGGYVANITEEAKNKLIDKGFYVFIDEEKNWLPTDPLSKNQKQSDTEEVRGRGDKGEIDSSTQIKERPILSAPRFDTPLTRQYTGKGVTIAVIDTGIYPHPDFISPNNRIKAFVDFVNGKKVPYDDNGHGTHVAGDAAGSGLMSDGLYQGPAPEADIVALKALAGKGGGKTSDIIKAIQWCIENKDKYNIKVVNMSLGHTAKKDYQNDPTNIAVKKAYEAGLVVVAAAGNEGPEPGTVAAPGDSPHAITVGANDDFNTPDLSDDKVTNFSSRGPTTGGLTKPDIIAPGEGIISPLSPNTDPETNGIRYNNLKETMKWFSQMPDDALVKVPTESLKLIGLGDDTIERWHSSSKQARKEIKRIFEAAQRRPIIDSSYVGMPGTSMASPIAAGVVAKMLQANPHLTPGQVKEILMSTADKIPGDQDPNLQGKGMIDPHEALEKALAVKDGSLVIPEPVIEWNPPAKEEKKQ